MKKRPRGSGAGLDEWLVLLREAALRVRASRFFIKPTKKPAVWRAFVGGAKGLQRRSDRRERAGAPPT